MVHPGLTVDRRRDSHSRALCPGLWHFSNEDIKDMILSLNVCQMPAALATPAERGKIQCPFMAVECTML